MAANLVAMKEVLGHAPFVLQGVLGSSFQSGLS